MSGLRLVSLAALLAVASACCATFVQAETTPTHRANAAQSHPGLEAKIRVLLSKNRLGGRALTLAIQQLLRRDPGAIAAVVAAAGAANAEQILALSQGVIEAQAQMKQSDPVGAQTIQTYLDANSTNAVVVGILASNASPSGNNGAGNSAANVGQAGSGAGAAGSGFVAGGGGQVSAH